MRFGIDLDGTIFEYKEGFFFYSPTEMRATPFPGCIKVLKDLIDRGHEVCIYTCRLNPTIAANKGYTIEQLREFVAKHLEEYKIPYTSISVYKPICDYYLDDRNIAFTTWANFERMMQPAKEEE